MNVTVVGGGNIGTQLAAHCSNAGHRVTMYTSRPEKFGGQLSVVNENLEEILRGRLHMATSDPNTAFSTAELVMITLPTLAFREFSEILLPYVKRGMKIAVIPGAFGELFFKRHIEKGAVVFGLQRVPSVARLVEYGRTVRAVGYRSELFAASVPRRYTDECCAFMQDIVGIKCSPLPNYLNITLIPSNPVLHTTRLRTIFRNYRIGIVYDSLPLFYEGWNDESSELLLKCDEEVQQICRKLSSFDLSYVRSLREHYESRTAAQLTAKITSIAGFRGLTTPGIKTGDGKYIPDFSSRYFQADFAYGLELFRQFAEITGTSSPNLNETIEWYYNVTHTAPVVSLADFGINSQDDINAFYSL